MLERVPGSGDIVAAEEIISLDGEPGLTHVARQLGRWLESDDIWVDRSFIEQVDAQKGDTCSAAWPSGVPPRHGCAA